MTRLPSSPCKWSWHSTTDLYRALGVKGTKIPKGMHGEWNIDGWRVVVKRSGPEARGGKPRVFVKHNGKLVPAGRVRQALCRTVVHRARKKAAAQRGSRGRFEYRHRR